jgi:AcrR family transcriptional regulator
LSNILARSVDDVAIAYPLSTLARPPTDLRDKILDAAVSVLRKHGERALTQTRVAKQAGIPQGHLTYYFPKKRDLVVAVAERFAELNREDVQKFFSARSGQPTSDVLLEYAASLIQNRGRTRMLLAMLVASDDEPALAKVLETNARALRALLSNALGRGDDDPVVDVFLSLLWGLGIREFVLRPGDGERVLEEVRALVGLKKSPKRD